MCSTDGDTVTQTAVGTDLLPLIFFLCWDQCAFCMYVCVCGHSKPPFGMTR